MYYPTDPGIYIEDETPQEQPDPDAMIIGSFTKQKIVDLCSLVKHRTVYAHSIAQYDVENRSFFSVNRGKGELAFNKLYDDSTMYTIVFMKFTPGHKDIQPPTVFINDPYSDHHLWMNGSLTPREKEKLQLEEDTNEDWDSMLMLKHVIRYGAPVDVDGSFACFYTDGKDLFIFRNEFEAMFMDEEMNVCSLPFIGSKSLTPNKMFQMIFEKKKLKNLEDFRTIRMWWPNETD